MTQNNARVEFEWSDEFEKKIEDKFENWGKCSGKKSNQGSTASGGAVYGVGMIGALVFYISTATSFWMGVLGVLKAMVWPAFLVFELFKFLSVG